MRIRVTKGRIACAVVLAPVLYVLNAGPMLYARDHFGVSGRIYMVMYWDLLVFIEGTPLGGPATRYLRWWADLGQPKSKTGLSISQWTPEKHYASGK